MAEKKVGQGDALEKLFTGLPTLNAQISLNRLVEAPNTLNKITTFVKEAQSVPFESLDADSRLLLKHALHAVDPSQPLGRPDLFLSGIADLAVKASVHPDDHSAKARYLRHFRWLAMGKKDEESPYQKQPVTNNGVDHAHLPENPSSKICAGCGSTDSKMSACAGCFFQTAGCTTFITAYCGKTCQRAHWKQHKVSCKGAQRFYHAASTFQAVFALFLELAHDSCGQCADIHEENGVLRVDQIDNGMELGLGFRGASILSRKFSPGQSAPSREAWSAALLASCCREVMTTALSIFELFIRPTIKSLERVRVDPQNMHKPMYESKGPNSPVNYITLWVHEILRVTLPGGQKIILDPSAAQFGWVEYIAPAEHYLKHRAQAICEAIAEPFPVDPMLNLIASMDLTSATVERKRKEAAALLAVAMQSYFSQSCGSFAKFLDMKKDEFEVAHDAAIGEAKRVLENELRAFQQGDLYKFYLSGDLGIRVADDLQLCNKLKKVWYSEEEYEKLKGVSWALRRRYLNRYRKVLGN